jgi:hypothetical protein
MALLALNFWGNSSSFLGLTKRKGFDNFPTSQKWHFSLRSGENQKDRRGDLPMDKNLKLKGGVYEA